MALLRTDRAALALTPDEAGEGGSVPVFRKRVGIGCLMAAGPTGGAVLVNDANGPPAATLPPDGGARRSVRRATENIKCRDRG